MALVPFLQGKTVAVMGLGKSGTSAARVLAESGARVLAWDDNPAAQATGRDNGLTVTDLATADLSDLTLMVWSPGIPHTHPRVHPVAEKVRRLGVKMVCDIDLLARANPEAQVIGITGTNGKSTTTTLTAHIINESGRPTAAGGNLGTPALDLPALDRTGTYVLELSSYQLELLDRTAFDAAVLLNITPDHLARHGGLEGYVAAKASLFERMRKDATAIVGVDDSHGQDICARLRQTGHVKVVPISAVRPVAGGIFAVDGALVDDTDGQARQIAALRTLPHLPGRHNWQNACAAYGAARAVGIDIEAIGEGLASYPGLAHRQELIARIGGIAYVNDSKATNADAVEKALVCYDDIYWILGGQAKEGGIVSLDPLFGRIRKAFLIGDATEEFARTLDGKVAFERCVTLATALARAHAAAQADAIADAVVLLSPACASWDQFTSFEHRGDVFRQLVTALPGARRCA
ncbi:UDP-N-acetylmuramoyl-L-alanine--D-glutamate ligase [Telmatospirillum sp.]|uniref:UDP-N-acetylmuramoyl-L-alanine--D-glutamate ligase n=1 Tax=Telmatospirillum sp. TaxID=2079197 RepID=UPI002841EF75|nr:UDP-N-acetylmuramoyl-L-alanine--D-glutamate ligase [Telmatospirillum sp.]MDR3435789.1 UDP-N-acetylmuramoyl-L-alanine--D-glutamate ligase [Telmatospirillum sp.]